MRIIGIDPGLRKTGWGIIEITGNRLTHVGNGVCSTDPVADLAVRLCSIYEQLSQVLAENLPDCAAVEHTFVNKDGAGTLKLGQARGISLLVPAIAGLKVAEYAPNAIKKSVVGNGHATKEQIQHMVRMQLPKIDLKGPDAADALAVALCHSYHLRFSNRLAEAIDLAEKRK